MNEMKIDVTKKRKKICLAHKKNKCDGEKNINFDEKEIVSFKKMKLKILKITKMPFQVLLTKFSFLLL